MKMKTKEILFAFVLGAVIPSLLFSAIQTGTASQDMQPSDHTVHSTQTQSVDETLAEPIFTIPVLMEDGSVQKMELDTYLTGVVLAEMPVEFEVEALKSQAVVARTYALRRYTSGEKHAQQAVCTDPSCCQDYCGESEFLGNGGTREQLEKVAQAVAATHDQVLTYYGELIEATYFSCSGGRTEDAKAVWGQEIPYLQAVDSPGEEGASHYIDTVSFTAREFETLLGSDFPGEPGTWIGSVTYTNGGGVDTIEIGGTSYKGTTVRQRLGLRSTAFAVTAVGNTITVTTKGYGHRVGMSQYGADAMAVLGSTYEEILAYYYQGTTLKTWKLE